MGILTWIIIGGLAGWLASIVMGTNREQNLVMDIVIGIVGALVGGFLMAQFGRDGNMDFDLGSLLTAFIGAIIVLFIWRAIAGRSRA